MVPSREWRLASSCAFLCGAHTCNVSTQKAQAHVWVPAYLPQGGLSESRAGLFVDLGPGPDPQALSRNAAVRPLRAAVRVGKGGTRQAWALSSAQGSGSYCISWEVPPGPVSTCTCLSR